MSVATKMARVDPGQKRKFNGSDSSGSRFHHAQRSPQRKAKLQAASQQRAIKQVGKITGIFTMEEDELYEAFQFGKKVGSGNWATVYEARMRSDGQIKAIKLVSRSPNGVTTEAARQRFEALKKEYRILRTIPSTVPWHVNIIRHDCFISTPATGCLVAPLHDEPMTVCLPLAMLRAYCLKLASALEWLHTYCICHNDVKLANIVVDRNLHDPIGEPILVDFGFATDHRPGGGTEFWTQDKMGTAEYLSPERAAGRLHDERLSDIWALGVSFFEMATGRTPFERPDEGPCNEESMGEYRRRIQDDEWYIDDDLPQDLVELCRLMVHKNPRLRLPLAEVSQHDFFRRESRDDPSDLENQRLHLEGRDESSDSFLNSSSGHSHGGQKEIPKTPSHLASKIAPGSLAFPGSPALDFDDLSFEPELIDSRAPWGSSADLSLKSEDLHSCHGHQHNYTVPRKAPKLAVPIDISAKRDKLLLCTPHSTATVKPTAAQTAPPLRFALQNASSKANYQQSTSVKVGFSPEKGTVKRLPQQQNKGIEPSKAPRNLPRAGSQGSPMPTRVLSPVPTELPIDLLVAAHRARKALGHPERTQELPADVAESDAVSIVSDCPSMLSSTADSTAHDALAAAEVCKTLWDSRKADHDQQEADQDSSFCSDAESGFDVSFSEDEKGGEGDPTIVLPAATKPCKISASAVQLEYQDSIVPDMEVSERLDTAVAASVGLVTQQTNLPDNDARASILAKLDAIERLVRETREELAQMSLTQVTSPAVSAEPQQPEPTLFDQASSRAASRQSLLRQLFTPTLGYEADCDSYKHGSDRQSPADRASAATNESTLSTFQNGSVGSLGHDQRSVQESEEQITDDKSAMSATSDRSAWRPSSASCSRLSVLCEDDQEEERQHATPSRKHGRSTSAAERVGSTTPRSVRQQPSNEKHYSLTTATRIQSPGLEFRSPTVVSVSGPPRPPTASSDKENHFVLVNGPESFTLPSGGSAAKLKRSFSTFRGRRVPSHDDKAASSAAEGPGGLGSTSMNGGVSHSRSKSAALSSLFSFAGQQQQQPRAEVNSGANEKRHVPSMSLDYGSETLASSKMSISTSNSASLSTRTSTPGKGLARRNQREAQKSAFGMVSSVEVVHTPKEGGSLWKRLVPSKAVPQRTI